MVRTSTYEFWEDAVQPLTTWSIGHALRPPLGSLGFCSGPAEMRLSMLTRTTLHLTTADLGFNSTTLPTLGQGRCCFMILISTWELEHQPTPFQRLLNPPRSALGFWPRGGCAPAVRLLFRCCLLLQGSTVDNSSWKQWAGFRFSKAFRFPVPQLPHL